MIYVALLRGINVGGNNKVEMSRLKEVFESAGMESVRTYINSGNVIFSSSLSENELPSLLENIIEKEFGFKVQVFLRSLDNIKTVTELLPDSWVNNNDMKCDILFLCDEFNKPDVINELTIKPEIDDVIYSKGAIIWRVDRKNINKSGLLKIIGTPLYKNATIRNCNTVRKLLTIMNQI